MAAKIITGIDVGSSKIAVVIAQVAQEEDKISVVGASCFPSQGVRKGQVVNIDEATQSIISGVEAAERMAGYSVSKTLVAIGGAHLASQNSKGVVAVAEPEGEINEEDVKRVIEAARAVSLPSSREIIHCLPRYFTVDSQEGIKDPVGMTGVRLEVETHIITGSSTSIRNVVKCISEIGANIEAVVFNGVAAAEAVLTETEKELGVVLVDIGGGTTDIVIFVEGSPAYATVLPVGAKNVTNDLAIGLRLSLENAEKLKLALSQEPKKPVEPEVKKEKDEEEEEKEEKKDEIDLSAIGIEEERKTISRKTLVEGIIKPRLNEIFTLVGIELKKSGFAGMTPSGIVITGGGAQTIGITEACKRTLAMPVRIGQPTGVSGLIDDIGSPAFAVVTGLILYGSKAGGFGMAKSSLPAFGKIAHRIPVKGLAIKAIDLIKSFLP
jgi:cell division protein FtsA